MEQGPKEKAQKLVADLADVKRHWMKRILPDWEKVWENVASQAEEKEKGSAYKADQFRNLM